MILDASGTPFPEKSVAEKYTEALCRARRDTKYHLTVHVLMGWSTAQHRHWVETGEEPEQPEHVK